MEAREQRPAMTGHERGDISLVGQNKDNINLSKRQRKVFDLLCTGWYSAADISIALHYADPRSYIRELRDKGINVLDEWIEGDETRYKRYTIKQPII